MIPRCIMYQVNKKKLLLFCCLSSLYHVLLFCPLSSPHFVNCVHLFLECFPPYLLHFLCSCVCWTVWCHRHILHVFVQCSLCCIRVLCSLPGTIAPVYWSYPSLTLSSQVLSILALPCLLSFFGLTDNWPSCCLPSLQILHIVCYIVYQSGSVPSDLLPGFDFVVVFGCALHHQEWRWGVLLLTFFFIIAEVLRLNKFVKLWTWWAPWLECKESSEANIL